MKKIIVRVTLIVFILSIVVTSISASVLIIARRNIDYELDEELFIKAKLDKTVYYYAYDNDNKLIEVHKSSQDSIREWTELEDIGENVKKAFVAMEDRDFYSHKGVNYKRTAKAIFNYIFKLSPTFGASTITQQVIKNISGDNEGSITRKAKEIFRALKLEKSHSKDDILEMYLNIVPMTGKIYGVTAASEIYFGKRANELSLSEAATIVGITNAPAKFNPYTNPSECIKKRNRVLYAMLDVGVIDNKEYEQAVNHPLVVLSGKGSYGTSSWFIETAQAEILDDLCEKFTVSNAAARMLLNGARVILTMNPQIQNILEQYFEDENNLSEKFKNGLNYSMVVSDPYTGDLKGIIGSGGRKKGELLLNYATAPVTPGSVLKPLAIYAPLIENGQINWSTMIEDSPIEYKVKSETSEPYPKNSPDIYEGMIDINDAIRKSKNTVAIRLFNVIGAEKIVKHLRSSYGFTTLADGNGNNSADMNAAPLALGQLTYGVSLRKLTEAYNSFPSEGIAYQGRSYTHVYDQGGGTILRKSTAGKRIYSTETSQIMNQLLSEVVISGTAKQIRLKELVDVAGKTGTSSKDRDRLFIGYTPYLTAGIWCGYGDGKSEVGYNSPNHIEIWDEVMKRIHSKLYFSSYEDDTLAFETDKIEVLPYCSKSGCIPTAECELDDNVYIKYGYFKYDSIPGECNLH